MNIKLNERTTIACRFIEGAKFELFNNLEHAIWQANAIATSIIPGPHPVFVIKVAESKYKISFDDSTFAVYVII